MSHLDLQCLCFSDMTWLAESLHCLIAARSFWDRSLARPRFRKTAPYPRDRAFKSSTASLRCCSSSRSQISSSSAVFARLGQQLAALHKTISGQPLLKRPLEYFVDGSFDSPKEGAVANVNLGFADRGEIDWIGWWVDQLHGRLYHR